MKGIVVKYNAWIHPESGGDDKEINGTITFADKNLTIPEAWNKSHAIIKSELRRLKSAVLDDYRIIRVDPC